MLKFHKSWADEIASISTSEEYQTATVRLEDPDLLTVDEPWDVDTNTETFEGDPVVYEGQARIIGVRWGVESGGESQANAKTLKAIRVQFPYKAVDRVRKGFPLYVTECERNPVLKDYVFIAGSDFQGSTAASRTIEFYLDGDSSWGGDG